MIDTRTYLWLSQSEPLLEYLGSDHGIFQCVCILHENCVPIPVNGIEIYIRKVLKKLTDMQWACHNLNVSHCHQGIKYMAYLVYY